MSKLQVITGGTSGMGLATARAVAKYGPVFIGGRNEKKLASALDELQSQGIDAHGCRLDVSDIESVREFAEQAKQVAPIGNVVHAAAVDMDVADTETITKINVIGTVNVVETFFPLLEEGGSVANYSSVTGYNYEPNQKEIEIWSDPNSASFGTVFIDNLQPLGPAAAFLPESAPAYFASKNFVMFYTKANVERFGKKGCRIFSVAPGSFMTPMLEHQEANFESIKEGTAFKRFGDPDEMAALFAALLDPSVAYLTGCDVLMDGGKLAMRTVPQLP